MNINLDMTVFPRAVAAVTATANAHPISATVVGTVVTGLATVQAYKLTMPTARAIPGKLRGYTASMKSKINAWATKPEQEIPAAAKAA